MKKHHPEQQDDEIYLGYNIASDMWKSWWQTSRLGNIVEDDKCKEDREYRPWFILRSEVQCKIDTEKAQNNSWSADRIRVYQEMLDRGSAGVGE